MEPEGVAGVFEGAREHGTVLRERVATALALEAEVFEGLLDLSEQTFFVRDHQVDHALPRASRDGRAADVLDGGLGRAFPDHLRDASGYPRGAGVVGAAGGGRVVVFAHRAVGHYGEKKKARAEIT